MNKFKVKRALQSGGEDVCKIAEKFLKVKVFTHHDLCWWVNPDVNWWSNKKQAKKLLKVLKSEKCCYEVLVMGGVGYEKTRPFVGLLHQILRVEKALKNKCVKKT